ncbi:hypothetical protein [Amycolatopsis sp. H20-H5]|uniref:hypothetical protein n=1 Tax=Amycolatopsis sp. H20-H5 TaxID=3046309 RepID=UPI002DBD3F05|nr:hypothetical protein [Amycolatopsis sp. H20-H5]MEC3979025.1 hypothetical protein [Amycolatopsis sp. H20-H5]
MMVALAAAVVSLVTPSVASAAPKAGDQASMAIHDASWRPGGFSLSSRSAYVVYQNDGNLVIYTNGRPVWATNTSGYAPGQLVMQDDSNFVLYDINGTPRWSSGTQFAC